jgi:hypothetical protein
MSPAQIHYVHRLNLARGYMARFMDTLSITDADDRIIAREFETIKHVIAGVCEAGALVRGETMAKRPTKLKGAA